MSKPTQMNAKLVRSVTIEASSDVRKFVAIVAGTIRRGRGANA